MTSTNARMNENAKLNDQLRAVAMQMALQARQPEEPWADVMQHAREIFDFLRVPVGAVQVVSSMPPQFDGAA